MKVQGCVGRAPPVKEMVVPKFVCTLQSPGGPQKILMPVPHP